MEHIAADDWNRSSNQESLGHKEVYEKWVYWKGSSYFVSVLGSAANITALTSWQDYSYQVFKLQFQKI